MEIKKIYLSEISALIKDPNAYLTLYLPENNEYVKERDFIVVCPGGSYEYLSPREGEIVALRFICEGFAAAVLNYSVRTKYPVPHMELGVALSYLRKNKDNFGTTSKISICGFSAGGHLVSSYGAWYKEIATLLNEKEELLRPEAIVAGYPVISTSISDKSTSFKHIANGEEELLKKMSVEKNITSDYPPTYLYTTKTDTCVDYHNSIMFDEYLTKNNVKHVFRLFESGEHGSSLANRSVYQKSHIELEKAKDIREWISDASDFIYSL